MYQELCQSCFSFSIYSNMFKLLFSIILLQFVIEKSYQKESKLLYSKAEMRTNPANMNTSQLTYLYKTVGSNKYVEIIEPFTVFFYRELKSFIVCKLSSLLYLLIKFRDFRFQLN